MASEKTEKRRAERHAGEHYTPFTGRNRKERRARVALVRQAARAAKRKAARTRRELAGLMEFVEPVKG